MTEINAVVTLICDGKESAHWGGLHRRIWGQVKPMRALTVCSRPKCPNLVETGRCPIHTRTDDARRGSSRARGYTSRWERTRAKHLVQQPICTECGAVGSVVDHIDGLGPLGPKGHDHENLRTLCKPCHDRRTARDQPGGWNRR